MRAIARRPEDDVLFEELSGATVHWVHLTCRASRPREITRWVLGWLKVGFAVVGVVPDAVGIGKPTILLAKPIRPRRSR